MATLVRLTRPTDESTLRTRERRQEPEQWVGALWDLSLSGFNCRFDGHDRRMPEADAVLTCTFVLPTGLINGSVKIVRRAARSRTVGGEFLELDETSRRNLDAYFRTPF